MATNKIATYGVKVDPKGAVSGSSRASKAIRGIGKTASNVKNRIFSLNGAMGALGAGAVMKSVIQSAAGLESLKVRLKFLTGSTLDAGKAFDTMTKFASKVPFALEDIQKASPLLLTVTDDIDELNGLLEMTGDIAAVSGLDFVKTAEQLQRAMAGGIASADLFRERGVAAFLGFEQGVQMSGEETSKALKEMWENNTTTAVGATKELANTFQGQVSMMEDAWFKLKIQFAETGVFEMAKDIVLDITESMGKPETVASIKEFGKGVVSVGKAIGSAISVVMGLPPWILETGLVMAVIGGTKARLVLAGLIALATQLDNIVDSFRALNDIHKDIRGKNQIDLIKALSTEEENLLELKKKTFNVNGSLGVQELAGALALQDTNNQKIEVSQSRIKWLREEIRANWDLKMAEKSFDVIDPKVPKGSKAPEPVVDPTIKKFKKLISTNDKYIESIKNVGVNLSDQEKLTQGYSAELERINEFADDNRLSEEQRAEAIANTTLAYEEATERLAEMDNPLALFEESIDRIFGNGGSFAKGIGDSTAQILVFGEKSSMTMKKLGQDILASVVSSLVEMGVQMAVNWAKEKIFKTLSLALDTSTKTAQTATGVAAIAAITTANVAAGVATTMAWTPAAAMVSLATFGANAAPAMAGITATTALAMTSAQMASLPSAEGGGFTGTGSRSGGVDGKGGFLSILHPKETVIDHTKGKKAGGVVENTVINNTDVNFTIVANDTAGFDSLLSERRGLIIGMINEAMNDRGQRGLA